MRHRSFRIDLERLNSAEECEQKLWKKISKLVVPGSLQSVQIRGLIEKLFSQVEEEALGENPSQWEAHTQTIPTPPPQSCSKLLQHPATLNSHPTPTHPALLTHRRVQSKSEHWRRSASRRRK